MAPPTDPAEGLLALRDWLRGRAAELPRPAYAAYYQSLTAAFFRINRFGVEDGFAAFTARDLLHFVLMSEGRLTEYFMRTGYARAIVEEDAEVLDLLATLPLIRGFQTWYHALLAMDEAAARRELAKVFADAEERAVTRLVLARRFPALIDPAWLTQRPTSQPQLGHALAKVIATRRRDLHARLLAVLRAEPNVLVAGEPDEILAPLVSAATEAPQKLLAPFEGYFGDPTVVAAAGWHLEHGEPAAALELVARVRTLSDRHDDARLIATVACCELKRVDDAKRHRDAIVEPAARSRATLALAQISSVTVATSEVVAIAETCTAADPELFFRSIRLLLARTALGEARELCRRREAEFSGHAQLKPIIDTILRPAMARVT
ncbi:MAG TPA: hypothetical protein VEL07_11475 [Planctomycetota bacterium]|nr:hypothetical protein [Planctomycetota bacterium]